MTKQNYLINIEGAKEAMWNIIRARYKALDELDMASTLTRCGEVFEEYEEKREQLVKSLDEQAVFMEKFCKCNRVCNEDISYLTRIFTRVNEETEENLEEIQRYMQKVEKDKVDLLGYLDTTEAREFVATSTRPELAKVIDALKAEYTEIMQYPEDTEF